MLLALSAATSLHMKVVEATVASGFNLTAEELARKLPSGQFRIIENRIGWARTYLFKAELIERVARGTYRISDAGRKFLAAHPDGISLAALHEVSAFRSWRAQSSGAEQRDPLPAAADTSASLETPTESMDRNEALRSPHAQAGAMHGAESRTSAHPSSLFSGKSKKSLPCIENGVKF